MVRGQERLAHLAFKACTASASMSSVSRASEACDPYRRWRGAVIHLAWRHSIGLGVQRWVPSQNVPSTSHQRSTPNAQLKEMPEHTTLKFVVILLATAVVTVVPVSPFEAAADPGYLIVGVLIGPHALGFVPDAPERDTWPNLAWCS